MFAMNFFGTNSILQQSHFGEYATKVNIYLIVS